MRSNYQRYGFPAPPANRPPPRIRPSGPRKRV